MDPAERAVWRLARACGVAPEHAAALRALTTFPESYPAGALIWTAAEAPRTKLMVTGWASELRILRDGRGQVFSFVICGDVVLARSAASLGSCTLVALTPVTCVDTSRAIARAPAEEREELRRAMEHALAITRERRYGLARRLRLRSRLARTADLLLELHDRLATVGLVTDNGFEMPLTHEQIADGSGLTPAQVRRSLRYLQTKHLAVLRSGQISGLDAAGLRAIRER